MIFCLEDDASIRDIEVYTLQATGFEAVGLPDAPALWQALRQHTPELILLDVMLPGTDGGEILKQLKASPLTRDIPVIMATAKGAEYDKISFLDGGADDYLVKPFGMMEMVARVKAVLRRSQRQDQALLSCGELVLDMQQRQVSVAGDKVLLTYKEFELLALLMAHPGIVFTRDRLLSEVWSQDYDGETRTVDVHIRTLRQKLGTAGAMIETIRSVGYRFGEMKHE